MVAKKRKTAKKKKAASKVRKARIPKTWAEMARMMDRVGKKFDTIPKSKKRGLSGSPEHHAREAERNMDAVIGYADQAMDRAAAGRCESAIENLRAAHKAVGAAEVNAPQAERGARFNSAILEAYIEPLAAAEKMFAQRCIVKKARPLAGLRRRKGK